MFTNQKAISRRSFIAGAAALGASIPLAAAAVTPATPNPKDLVQDIAFARGNTVMIIDSNGVNERILHDFGVQVHRLEWSPSGRYLLVSHGESTRAYSVFDTVTESTTRIERYAAWAFDADELLLQMPGSGRKQAFQRISPMGKRISTTSIAMPDGGLCTIEFEPTTYMALAWMQGDAMTTASMYPNVLWSAADNLAYVQTLCDVSFEVDMSQERAKLLDYAVIGLAEHNLLKLRAGFAPEPYGLVQQHRRNGAERVIAGAEGGIPIVAMLSSGGIGGYRGVPRVPQATPGSGATVAAGQREIVVMNAADTEPRAVAETNFGFGGLPQLSTQGHYMVLGTLDSESEIDLSGPRELDPQALEDRFSQHFRMQVIDLRTGDVREIATGCRVPRIRPKGAD